MPRDTRPNILYVFTDQQSAFAMSCVGNPDLDTPVMDGLAEEGVRFEQTYCTQPLCTPCRGSMFTGLMPHVCGTPRNGVGIHEHLRSRELGRVLNDGGYECLYGGKWHVPGGSMPTDNDHGFRAFWNRGDHGLAQACTDEFKAWQGTAAGDRKPFFMVASYVNPHDICQIGRNQRLPWGPIAAYPPLADCPNLPANFAIPPFEPEIIRIEQACHWAIYPYREHTPEEWRRLRWGYCRLVEKVDQQIGQLLDGLRQYGLDEDTLIVFSSDHGDGQGAHQWNQKCALYEEVVRVPMIVRPPGGRQGCVDTEHLVSNALDLFPTACDYAGVTVPQGLPGLSLRPLVEGHGEADWRDHLVVETLFDGSRGYDTQGRCIRTKRFKYIVYDRGRYPEQLFELTTDPGEMVNLAVETRFQSVLDEHRRLLARYMEETDDKFRPTFMDQWPAGE